MPETPDQIQAILGWTLIAVTGVSACVSLYTDTLLWGVFVLTVALVAALPALALRDWTVTIPWPLLTVAALAATARAAGVYREAAGYLAIVALALMVVIELDAFTPVQLSRRFAVAFSVMVTMALEGVWIIAQTLSDRWLGSELVVSQSELQWDIVLVTILAITVGLLYHGYATRYRPTGSIAGGRETR